MHLETIIVILFAVATTVALVARWLRVPYTVALVVAGLALGAAHAFEPPHLTKELLYAVFLPGLLFEAAFHLDFAKFKKNKITIVALAVPGVIAAISLTGGLLTPVVGALHFVEGFTLGHGLVFGALIAATDPIAVVGLFKSLGAPKQLAVMVEGESLLNDGTAVVLFTLILAAVSGESGSSGGLFAAGLEFVRVVGMGLLIGLTFGFLASKLTQVVDEPMIEITITTIAAYGSFVAAEQFHFSGVIATVSAGMLCGNYAATTGMSPSTRIAVESFWEYLAFALNSVVFLLIGFSVSIEMLIASAFPIVVAFGIVLLARGVVVSAASGVLRFTRERVPFVWTLVLIWGGLRGGLSMVLVLGLPPTFPHRELLVTMTYGVVVLSILVQGLSMTPLLRWLGLIGMKEDRYRYEVERGELRAVRAALLALERMVREGQLHGRGAEEVREDYLERQRKAEEAIKALHLETSELEEEERKAARRHLLLEEKGAVISDAQRGLISPDAAEHLQREIDARLFRLESDEAQYDEPPDSDAAPDGAEPAGKDSPGGS